MISGAVDCVSQRFNSICRGDAMALALRAAVVRCGRRVEEMGLGPGWAWKVLGFGDGLAFF